MGSNRQKYGMFLVAAILSILSLPGFVHGQIPGTEKWHFLTGSIVFSSPAIGADGTIYVGSDDNNLYAINPDGTKKWDFATGWFVPSSPAIGGDGTVYVGSEGYNLYAINPDGTEKWHFLTGNSVYSSPAIGADGTIYVGSDDNNLYAINPDGTKKWDFATGGSVFSSPAIGADGTIYVGSYDFNLYAINPDGTKKWDFATWGPFLSSPAIGADGTIYVGSFDNNLLAVNPDGTEKWRFVTGDAVMSSPAIGADGAIYVGSYDNNLYAVYSTSPGLADTSWPMFHHDLKHTGRVGPMAPVPDIKANGTDGPVFVTPGGNVNITISLDPGNMAWEIAEWWIGILTPFGSALIPLGQIPIFELPEISLFNIPLPEGLYMFFFVLDDKVDGRFNVTWYDYVVVICSSAELDQMEGLSDFEALFHERMKELVRE